LRNWQSVFEATAVDGAVHFVEDRMDNFSHRFYRLTSGP